MGLRALASVRGLTKGLKISNPESDEWEIKERGHAKSCSSLFFFLSSAPCNWIPFETQRLPVAVRSLSGAFNTSQSDLIPLLPAFLWPITEQSQSFYLSNTPPLLILPHVKPWGFPLHRARWLIFQSPSLCWRHFTQAQPNCLFLYDSTDL